MNNSEFSKSNLLEVELTTKCTVKCPSCPRNKHTAKDWNYGNIQSDDLLNFVQDHLNEIVFSGAYGDPIYHPEFIKIVSELKRKNKMISIDTNGSYMSENWWDQLASVLDIDDALTFSVDGSPANFTNYRINADWPSIQRGMKIMSEKSQAMLRWKYIIFRYNCDFETLKEAYDTARQLGIRHFQLVQTARFPPGQEVSVTEFSQALDQLEDYVATLDKPRPKLTINIHPRTRKIAERPDVAEPERVNQGRGLGQNMRRSQRRQKKVVTDLNIMNTEHVHPQCVNLVDHDYFIGADGIHYPCCYVYSDIATMQSQFNLTDAEVDSMRIQGKTQEEIISGPGFQKIMQGFDSSLACRTKCPRIKH